MYKINPCQFKYSVLEHFTVGEGETQFLQSTAMELKNGRLIFIYSI